MNIVTRLSRSAVVALADFQRQLDLVTLIALSDKYRLVCGEFRLLRSSRADRCRHTGY